MLALSLILDEKERKDFQNSKLQVMDVQHSINSQKKKPIPLYITSVSTASAKLIKDSLKESMNW